MAIKLCTIVGAGPGLGLALAKRFGQAGFVIALVSRRPESRKNYPALLRDSSISAVSVFADPADGHSLEQAFAAIKTKLGPTEVLIYNAMVLSARPNPSKLPMDSLLEELKVDVVGPLVCAQQVIPDMRAQGSGTIFFTAGGQPYRPQTNYTGLGMGRAALRHLCQSLGAELKPQGIYVAMVTIQGVQPRNPEFLADAYWEMYRQDPKAQKNEVVVQ